MKSEKEYRIAVDTVLQAANGDARNWNNSFIIACAIHGILLIPITKGLPFKHYIQAPFPIPETGGTVAWPESYMVDFDYEQYLKPQNIETQFNFEPRSK